MTRKSTTDDGLDRATLRRAANDPTNGPIDQLHDILKCIARDKLRDDRECDRAALGAMEDAAALRTVRGYATMTLMWLEQIASHMQPGEGVGDRPEYLELCDRDGPCCDCEVVCKHKPKHLYAEREKAFARSEQQRRRFFRSQAQKA